MVGSRVYVGGLPYGVRERDLERFFKGYGRTRDILIKNGYGFVEFEDHRDADDAVYELNGKELLGERVVVEPARGTARGGGGRDRNDDRGRRSGGRGDKLSSRFGPPERTENRIIVENLSSRISWQDLKDYMRQAGEVTYADAHKQHRNEGVVEFATSSDMRNAIDKLDDTDLNGRRIRLTEDRPKSGRGRGRSRSSSSPSRSPRRRSRSSRRGRSSRSRSKSSRRGRSRRTKSPAKRSRSRSIRRTKATKNRSHSRSRSVSSSAAAAKRDSRSRSPIAKRQSRSRSRSAKRIDRSRSPAATVNAAKAHSRSRSRSVAAAPEAVANGSASDGAVSGAPAVTEAAAEIEQAEAADAAENVAETAAGADVTETSGEPEVEAAAAEDAVVRPRLCSASPRATDAAEPNSPGVSGSPQLDTEANGQSETRLRSRSRSTSGEPSRSRDRSVSPERKNNGSSLED